MIADPDIQAPRYAEHGSASVTFHLEAADDPKSLISNIASYGARVGIAIKPGTPFSAVEPFMSEIDMLLVMTVEPGFGGQKFMSDMMPKVAQARSWISSHQLDDLWLQVDGGISLATISEATLSGADTFVAGRAVFNAPTVAALDAGVHSIGKKIVEEAAEVWMAAEYQSPEDLALEISQLLYHVQVLMIAKNISIDSVYNQL